MRDFWQGARRGIKIAGGIFAGGGRLPLAPKPAAFCYPLSSQGKVPSQLFPATEFLQSKNSQGAPPKTPQRIDIFRKKILSLIDIFP